VQVCVSEWLLIILPSPISELQHAPLPLKVLRAKEHAPIPYFSIVFTSNSHLSLSKSLGARHWSSEMGTRKIDKHINYSHELAQTKQVG